MGMGNQKCTHFGQTPNLQLQQHDPDLVVLEGMDQLLHRNFNIHFKYNILKLAVVKD
jgi:folate-dependent phosphoribosylglycinamide formyltransferase PurN